MILGGRVGKDRKRRGGVAEVYILCKYLMILAASHSVQFLTVAFHDSKNLISWNI